MAERLINIFFKNVPKLHTHRHSRPKVFQLIICSTTTENMKNKLRAYYQLVNVPTQQLYEDSVTFAFAVNFSPKALLYQIEKRRITFSLLQILFLQFLKLTWINILGDEIQLCMQFLLLSDLCMHTMHVGSLRRKKLDSNCK